MSQQATFPATLSAQARLRPDATALVESGRRSITFGELDVLADRYASGLARRGVRSGDRALYLLRPSIDGYAVFYALLRLGAVPVFIDPRLGLRPMLRCVETIRPRVALVVPLLRAFGMLARRPFAATELWLTSRDLRQCLGARGETPSRAVSPNAESHLPFTSGSTGAAKAVRYTHGMVRAQVELVHEVCGWHAGMTAVMCFAPFVPYALADGLTVVLPDMDFSQPAAARPNRIVEAITTHQAECAFASPILWRNLARHCERHGIALGTLRRAVTVGAPVPIDLHRRLGAVMHPEGRLYTPYGATEAMPVTTTDTGALAETWPQTRNGYGTCIGKPLTGIEVLVIRVTDDPIPRWSDDRRVRGDAIGELVVAGPIVSPLYPERVDATAAAKIQRDGAVLHRTGDLGRIDAAGRVWFCGRKSQRIETSTGMLAPVAIENIFNAHPAVFRTALVGVGPRGSQRPVACIELEAGATLTPRLEAELLALAEPTCFRGVVTGFLPHPGFPVDARHNAKIKREALAAWAAGKLRVRR